MTPATVRPVRRLRPGVAVTPLRAGLHLRGRGGSLTLEGSTALPALWKLLEEPLREGRIEALLDGMEPGSAPRRAVDTLLRQLEAHGLLMTGDARPPGEDPVGRWLAESAERPADAAAALAGVRAEVLAADPGDPLARAAAEALERGGPPVTRTAGPDLPGARILLRVHGGGTVLAVAAGRAGAGGYATAPGSPAQAAADARALEARLGPAEDAGPAAFPALLAGAAAHRLLCAAAGLADPATEGGDARLLPGLPAVLLADARPLRADYRTWLGPARIDADRRTGLAPARTLGEALRRLDALGDARCGVLPGPEPGGLVQLPVPLAACALPDGRITGGAPRLDLARLELFCRAAELLLGEGGFTVGVNPGHARGRALRAAAARRGGGAAVPGGRWSGHPQARHWWTTLTARLGVPARLEVRRAAPGEEVYHAVVHRTGNPAPLPLGEAVEATPGDAAAFAALAAIAKTTAPAPAGPATLAGPATPPAHPDAAPGGPAAAPGMPAVNPGGPAATPGGPHAVPAGPETGRGAACAPPSGGAVAPLAVAGARIAAWEDPGWTNGWMADVARREAGLQAALERITGAAFAETGGGFAETEAVLAELGGGFAETEAVLAELGGGFAEAEAAFAELGGVFAEAEAALAGTGGGFAEAEAAFAETEAAFAEAEAAFAETGGGFAETGAAFAETEAAFAATGAAPHAAGASSHAAGLAARLRAFGFTVLNRGPEEAR
ncbi:hypothetical protein GCM10010302_18470 [Streptomyces polychromogenes]|uniref:Uncharacterized protein n=1 Tax=Streptomyces polychromogenes TaxID=67342 RepID=A0ABN0V8Y9_9ACTN